MPFLISNDSPAATGIAAIGAGQSQGAWRDLAIAQQQQAFAAQQQQQQLENQVRARQQQFENQKAQAEFAQRQQDAKSLEASRQRDFKLRQQQQDNQYDLGQKRVGTQQDQIAATIDKTAADNETRLALGKMKDAQFLQTYGLRKDQLQDSMNYHDAKIRQGDQNITLLAAWRDAQLKAGVDKARTLQQWHLAVQKLKEQEAQRKLQLDQMRYGTPGSPGADPSSTPVAAPTGTLPGSPATLNHPFIPAPAAPASGSGTIPGDPAEGKGPNYRVRYDRETGEPASSRRVDPNATIVGYGPDEVYYSDGTKAFVDTGHSNHFADTPTGYPNSPSPSTPSSIGNYQPASGMAPAPSTPAPAGKPGDVPTPADIAQAYKDSYADDDYQRQANATTKLIKMGYKNSPDGTPLQTVRENLTTLSSLKKKAAQKAPLTASDVQRLLEIMGSKEAVKQFIEQGYGGQQ